MSRITTSIAEDVATALLKEKYENLGKAQKEVQKMVFDHLHSLVPEKVMKLWNDPKTKNWIQVQSTARFIGQGLNHDTIHYGELPCDSDYSYRCVELPKEFALEVNDRIQENEKMNQKIIISVKKN